jgi:hypothetical protein
VANAKAGSVVLDHEDLALIDRALADLGAAIV